MEDKKHLEDLNKATLEKLQEYAARKEHLPEEHKKQLHTAKEEWQASWSKLMEVLITLERIEI